MNMRAFLLGILTLCSTPLYTYCDVSSTNIITDPALKVNKAKKSFTEQAASWFQYARQSPQVIRKTLAQDYTRALYFAKEHKTDIAIGALCAVQIALMYKLACIFQRVQELEKTQPHILEASRLYLLVNKMPDIKKLLPQV